MERKVRLSEVGIQITKRSAFYATGLMCASQDAYAHGMSGTVFTSLAWLMVQPFILLAFLVKNSRPIGSYILPVILCMVIFSFIAILAIDRIDAKTFAFLSYAPSICWGISEFRFRKRR